MSFKQAVTKVGENHYVLPKIQSMRVEAHAFLSDALYLASEEGVWLQIANGASYEGVIGAYLMPDTHLGYGLPIGSVIVTDTAIIQGGSGYDISCFTGDTRVPLVDGRTMTLVELAELGGEVHVYSITSEGRVTAGRAHSARKTRTSASLVEVELDNGTRLRCTPDHQWMRRDGSYAEARDLQTGDSLMPLYRELNEGYCTVLHPVDNAHNNHKVVAVRPLNTTEDVYCLTVDKYANFALDAGVFVHNCGVVSLKVPSLKAEDVRDRETRRAWVNEVGRRIATGIGSNRPGLMPNFSAHKAEEILRYGAKAINVQASVCKRQYIPVPDSLDLDKIEKAYSKVIPQLGSVGGGDHFIEMQVDRDTGDVWVMIHCGSRGYGWQTTNHFFYEGARLRGIPSNRREDSWLYADESLGREYWAYHNSAANFAVANRHIIVEGVREALQEIFKADCHVYYEISHNLVQEETLVLPDGTTKKGFVHRKGATRAFPAGHPDLVGTVWEKTGHPCCIPGSMYEGAAILFPREGAYKSACSVNHGSGRVMARGEAKRKLGPDQAKIDAEMREVVRTFNGVQIEGIVGNTCNTLLDECGHVYKDLDEVLAVLETESIARIAHRLYPVCNLKGID